MMNRVMLGGIFGMLGRLKMMPMGQMGVMTGGLVLSSLVMFGRLPMMPGGMFMMLSGFLVMLGAFMLGH
jgi:hypothetical protein